MKKCTNYIILKDIDLVIEYYSGEIMIDDIINLKKKVFSENDYHKDIKIIMDFRNAITKIEKSDFLKYLEFTNDNIALIGDRKVALLTSQPNHVVLGVLFEYIKNKPMKTEVFSTLDAAVYWLQVNINSFTLIENSILNVANKSYDI